MSNRIRGPAAADAFAIPRSTRLYLLVDTGVRRLLRSAEAVHRGIWLGLLDRPALDAATRAMYGLSASYSQSPYNQSGLHYWEEDMLNRYFVDARSLVVAAAGGGREIIALAKRGIRADGFDPEASFVHAGSELLQRLGIDARLLLSEPSDVPAGLGQYDGAIIGWNAYSHIPGRTARQAFLGALMQHVRPGGRVLVSFFGTDENDRALRLIHWVARAVGLLRWRKEPAELGDTLMTGYYHFFSESELTKELQQIGLCLRHFAVHPNGHAIVERMAADALAGEPAR